MRFLENYFSIEFPPEILENLNNFLEEYMINSGVGVENVDLNLSPNLDNDEEAMSPVDASDDVENPENINSQNNDVCCYLNTLLIVIPILVYAF